MSRAILTNNDIALIMELHTETGHRPNFWKCAAIAMGRTAEQLHNAIRDRKQYGMYKRGMK